MLTMTIGLIARANYSVSGLLCLFWTDNPPHILSTMLSTSRVKVECEVWAMLIDPVTTSLIRTN